GKTTLLEAIAICAFSKSFQPVSDLSLIKYGETSYFSELSAINDLDINYKVKINYQSGSKKEINSTFGNNLLAKDIIGILPLVVLSPDLKIITSGSPQDRRDFIDRLLSQSSRTYLEKLMDYRKILKQRNNFLNRIKHERIFDRNLLESWTEMLISKGIDLIIYRNNFIRDFIPFFESTYNIVSKAKETVKLEYLPNNISSEMLTSNLIKKDLYDVYKLVSTKLENEEIRRGLTLFGPQKDELSIKIDSGIAKESASQGQHKTLLVSLKFAEFNFLKEKRNETPVVLLDDIFSELDSERVKKVFELLISNSAQTFITITDIGMLKDVASNSEFSFYKVN
ncbi:MAG: DNA replication and repair protein RecF, partial [Ignavibacteria bacterium]|nr:DNA replication and repair protein RecF [Ignavibacteria bacterium]